MNFLTILEKVFNFRRKSHVPTPLFNNKPVKPKTLLIWDLENISFKHFEEIEKRVDYTPEKAIIVTTQKLGYSLRKKINNRCFDLYDGLGDSDSKIIQIMRISRLNNEFIIVSSDADFVKISKELLSQDRKVLFIVNNSNKKRVVMKSKLTDPNLKIRTF